MEGEYYIVASQNWIKDPCNEGIHCIRELFVSITFWSISYSVQTFCGIDCLKGASKIGFTIYRIRPIKRTVLNMRTPPYFLPILGGQQVPKIVSSC